MRGAGEGRPLTEVDAGGSGGMIVGPRCSSWYSGPAGGTESPPTPRKIDEDRLPTPSSSSVRTIEEMAEPPKYPLKSVFLQQLAPQDAQRRGGQARPVPLLRPGEPPGGPEAEPARARPAGAPGAGSAAARGQAGPGAPDAAAVPLPELPSDDDGRAAGAVDPAAVQRGGGGAGAVPVGTGQAEGGPGLCAVQ